MARNNVKQSSDEVGQPTRSDTEGTEDTVGGGGGGDARSSSTSRGRSRTSSPTSDKVRACPVCGAELARISMMVDNTALLMESCDVCDIRRWQFAGEQIDLQHALEQVGEHAGRRR